jgi:hypothetical protein
MSSPSVRDYLDVFGFLIATPMVAGLFSYTAGSAAGYAIDNATLAPHLSPPLKESLRSNAIYGASFLSLFAGFVLIESALLKRIGSK